MAIGNEHILRVLLVFSFVISNSLATVSNNALQALSLMHCTCLLLNMGAHASFVQMSILHFTAIHVNQNSKAVASQLNCCVLRTDCSTSCYLAHVEPESY